MHLPRRFGETRCSLRRNRSRGAFGFSPDTWRSPLFLFVLLLSMWFMSLLVCPLSVRPSPTSCCIRAAAALSECADAKSQARNVALRGWWSSHLGSGMATAEVNSGGANAAVTGVRWIFIVSIAHCSASQRSAARETAATRFPALETWCVESNDFTGWLARPRTVEGLYCRALGRRWAFFAFALSRLTGSLVLRNFHCCVVLSCCCVEGSWIR